MSKILSEKFFLCVGIDPHFYKLKTQEQAMNIL